MFHPQTAMTIDDYLAEEDIHEREHQSLTGSVLALIFSGLLTLAHAFNLYLLFWVETAVLLNIIIHVILVAIAGFLVVLSGRSGTDRRFAQLLFITTPFLSVVGAFGVFVAILQSVFYMRFRSSFEEWYASIFPKGQTTLPEEIAEDIELGRDEHRLDYHVIPFMDVMEVGSERQKRQALTKMATSFHPRFAPAFKRALADDSSTIRIQAATSISRIESRFHDRVLQIENLLKEYPDNNVVLRALASHYDDYAFTGLLDHERELLNREKAKHYYLKYLNLVPDDVQARVSVGRLLVRMGRDDDALEWFRNCISEGYQEDAIKVWYIESLYRQKQFDTLRQVISSYQLDITRYQAGQDGIADSIYLWAQAGLAAQQQQAAG